jgi:molecular chaperone DnaK (HSP70)
MLPSLIRRHISVLFAYLLGSRCAPRGLTRSKLEQLVGDLIERTRSPVMQALEDAGIKASDVDEVVLVGGQTRMPAVIDLVRKI